MIFTKRNAPHHYQYLPLSLLARLEMGIPPLTEVWLTLRTKTHPRKRCFESVTPFELAFLLLLLLDPLMKKTNLPDEQMMMRKK